MATGHFNEYAAYTKLILRLMICGTKVFRRLLKTEISKFGQPLEVFLTTKKNRLLKSIVGKLNESSLFPLNGNPPDIESWDICLIVHILTECPYLPASFGSDLKRLREIRNNLVHSAGAKIEERLFTDYWIKIGDIIGQALTVINDNGFSKEIQEYVRGIENGLFVQDIAEYQRIIIRWFQLDSPLTEQLAELLNSKYNVAVSRRIIRQIPSSFQSF